MNKVKIGVIIATSMSRVEELFNRSLYSVLKQTRQADCIVVVDDNNDHNISEEITRRISVIGNKSLHYIRNSRTKNMSGTGAWNTGVDYLTEQIGINNYFAILDDDDCWDETYLEIVHNTICNAPDNVAVFAFLKRSDCENVSAFTKKDLCVNSFLIGNPGIQGSNMCFKINSFKEINGFDEKLASCTDRDLMIRFLLKNSIDKISIIPQKFVNHFASGNTVTSNYTKKKDGLDVFYQKHITLFDFWSLQKSLKRAEKLFHYNGSTETVKFYRKTHSILITGVCGFIGSHLAKTMVKLGYTVVGVDDLSTGNTTNISNLKQNTNFELNIFSILEKEKLKDLFYHYNIYYVLHCAALPRIKYSMDYPKESYCANVEATRILAEICKRRKIKRFVFCSSSSVYGESTKHAMNENDEIHPISPYAQQKAEAEKSLINIFQHSNTNLTILRLFNVYGFSFQPINTYSTLINRLIYNALNNKPQIINGNGLQKRDFTYISDVVNAFVQVLEHFCPEKANNIINIGTSHNYSVNEVISLLSQITGEKYSIQYNTEHYFEPSFTLADNALAYELLNWKPQTDIIDGLKNVYNQTLNNQIIAVGIAIHNNIQTIRRCLKSALGQKKCKRNLVFVLADDNSSDNWSENVSDLLEDDRIIILHFNNSNVVKTRNMINDYIKSNIGNVVLIGRLDADDEYASDTVLSEIETIFDKENPDLILAGNYLRQNGQIIGRKNLALKELANANYVLYRLKQMSENNPEGELPSCNMFVKPDFLQAYPGLKSGEDHALLVHYLINQDKYKLYFAEDLLLTIYNLGGNTTANNKKSENYINCRKQLYKQTLELCTTKNANNKE